MLDKLNLATLDYLMDECQWWAVEQLEGMLYLTNRIIALRIGLKECKESDDGIYLMSIINKKFNGIPEEGEIFIDEGLDNYQPKNGVATGLKKFFDQGSKTEGKVTAFSQNISGYRYRWSKFPEFSAFHNDDYIELLVDPINAPIYADGPTAPSFLLDGKMIILPVKGRDSAPFDINGLMELEQIAGGNA